MIYGQEYLPPVVVLVSVLLGWRRVALAAIAATVTLNADNWGCGPCSFPALGWRVPGGPGDHGPGPGRRTGPCRPC